MKRGSCHQCASDDTGPERCRENSDRNRRFSTLLVIRDQRERQDDDRKVREPGDDRYATKPRLPPDEDEPFPQLCDVSAR